MSSTATRRAIVKALLSLGWITEEEACRYWGDVVSGCDEGGYGVSAYGKSHGY